MGVYCDVCMRKKNLKIVDPKSESGNKKYPIPKKVERQEDDSLKVVEFYILDLCDKCICDILGYGALVAGIDVKGLMLPPVPKEEKPQNKAKNPVKTETKKNEDSKSVSKVSKK